MEKALLVNVYRNVEWERTGVDCSGGPSSREEDFFLIGDGVEGPFEIPGHGSTYDGRAILKLDRRGGGSGLLRAVPVVVGQKAPWFMFGGNFIYSSDSRFAALNNGYPIPIHDRVETAEESAVLGV